jgi:predicted RND superfamily exporter protein
LARGVTKFRWVSVVMIVALSGVLYASSAGLEEEAFGDPGKNFPADDPIRMEHELGLQRFYERDGDVKTNILVFEGDNVLTPENIAYMRAIESNLRQQDRVIGDTLRTLMFFIETWQTVKSGAGCAAGGIGASDENAGTVTDPASPVIEQAADQGAPCADEVTFPQTAEEIEDLVNEMFDSPMRQIASIIVNYPSNDMVAMTFGVEAETYDDAAEVWDQVWAAIDSANTQFGGQPPEGVQVAYVGNTATNYLFVAEQLPWLAYMGYASTIILFILVLLFTGDIKATIIATAAAGLTTIWWLGILPLIDIGLAITLMLPVVFIFNIGTDYVVHLVWNMKKVGDYREVWETTGKAIFFSAITTAGSFAVFIQLQNVAVSRTMVATTISIGVIFAVTILVLPVFYKVLKPGDEYGVKRVQRTKAVSSGAGKTITAAKRSKPKIVAVKLSKPKVTAVKRKK